MSSYSRFSDPSVLLVFTYAPAGLGHLRVTDALYHGLPRGLSPVILGSQEKSITFLHRLTSASPSGRRFQEFFQYGLPEKIFSRVYRNYLRCCSGNIFSKLVTLIDSRLEKPKKLVIISTHFAMAHQISAVKERIEREKSVRIFLFVQVTDDSPQAIWYVPGADIEFVPSVYTKDVLVRYGQVEGLPGVDFRINPYPVSPHLAQHEGKYYSSRLAQSDPLKSSLVNIAIPVSGAAVGLKYLLHLMSRLHTIMPFVRFHIVSRIAPFTSSFLDSAPSAYVHASSHRHDRDVVDAYENLYKEKVMLLEITKPSEQAFKLMLSTSSVGGSLVLFSHPVGRQEYDNLHFLSHHNLIPHTHEYEMIWSIAGSKSARKELIDRISSYRGLVLPDGSARSAMFIKSLYNFGILKNMVRNHKVLSPPPGMEEEVGSTGVGRFWDIVSGVI